MASPAQGPSPQLFFDSMFAFKRTTALVAAIELDLFTAIAELKSPVTAAEVARRIQASERGTRILCDFLVINGFLAKGPSGYSATPDTAMFLDTKSTACVSGAARFLAPPPIKEMAHMLAETVRKGTTVLPEGGAVAPENEIWIDFARGMAPLMMPAAEAIAGLVAGTSPCKVLDIAASHGMFGITIARHNPNAQIVAQDWKNVLEVTKENAQKAGLNGRLSTLPGSAFDVEFGKDYDVVLLTNFLHHFDPPTCEQLLRKCRAALKPGGRAAVLEFVPNDDRVTPPFPAAFSLTMLEATPNGDAYTQPQLQQMAVNAGYSKVAFHPLGFHPETVVVLEN